MSAHSVALRARAELELRRRGVRPRIVLLPQPYTRSFVQHVDAVHPRYEWAAHHELAAGLLQQVADGDIRRLMLFWPPRHGKSELATRLFASYFVRRNPTLNVGITAATDVLAQSFGRSAREYYKESDGKLAADSTAAKLWRTAHDGEVWSRGVTSSIVGHGWALGLIDDPIPTWEAAMSLTQRNKQWSWYKSEFLTREAQESAIVLSMTRWHEDALEGRILRQAEETGEVWHVVHLPAVKEPAPAYPAVAIVHEDERPEGSALWPERYPLSELAKHRADPATWEPLYQQRPGKRGGSIMRSEWFDLEAGRNRYHETDGRLGYRGVTRWLFADTAMTSDERNDATSVSVFDLLPQAYDYKLALRHQWAGRIDDTLLPTHFAEMAAQWNHDGNLAGIVIENKASGHMIAGLLQVELGPAMAHLVKLWTPAISKVERAQAAALWAKRNMLLLPYPSAHNADWYDEFLADEEEGKEAGELWRFPFVTNDDRTDSYTMAPAYLINFLTAGFSQIVARQTAESRNNPWLT